MIRTQKRNATRRRATQPPNSLEPMETRCLLSGAGVGLDSVHDVNILLATFADYEATDFASIDGTGNNENSPTLGTTGTQLLRITTSEYADGLSAPAGEERPSARAVSNAVAAQDESVASERLYTDLLWLWGQFLDHDIDLTEGAEPAEPFPIEVPSGDPFFDPMGMGTQTIDLNRSVYDETTGNNEAREQINLITSFIDGSVVYGSDDERAAALRTFEGGRLATSDGDLLPFNEQGLANAGGTGNSLFLAGDVRANENVALSAMHTVWVREHNWWADQIAAAEPDLTDEQIFQRARAIVTAEIQAITYNEFLPALLGVGSLDKYTGYDETVDPSIANIFSTAAYRLGHSMLSGELLRLNNDGTGIDDGNLALRDAFFAPDELIDNGIDSILLGAASQVAQNIDNLIVDDVRNFLFGPPGSGGFDLASLNIQRGRDHGLPDYNQARVDLGLDPVTSFDEISSDPIVVESLESVYDSVDDIDVWVAGLAEDHVAGAGVGELFQTILVDQFERLRDGDRYWYQNVFSGAALGMIESTTLADVLERNTDIEGLQANVFYDSSVLYFDASGHRGANVTVTTTVDAVNVINTRTRRVLASASADDIAKVILVGSARRADRFTIDIGGDGLSIPNGIDVFGGRGSRDVLVLRGTPGDDVIAIDGSTATVNGTMMTFTQVESVRVRSGSGHDSVEVSQEVDARVIVDGRPARRATRPGSAANPALAPTLSLRTSLSDFEANDASARTSDAPVESEGDDLLQRHLRVDAWRAR